MWAVVCVCVGAGRAARGDEQSWERRPSPAGGPTVFFSPVFAPRCSVGVHLRKLKLTVNHTKKKERPLLGSHALPRRRFLMARDPRSLSLGQKRRTRARGASQRWGERSGRNAQDSLQEKGGASAGEGVAGGRRGGTARLSTAPGEAGFLIVALGRKWASCHQWRRSHPFDAGHHTSPVVGGTCQSRAL